MDLFGVDRSLFMFVFTVIVTLKSFKADSLSSGNAVWFLVTLTCHRHKMFAYNWSRLHFVFVGIFIVFLLYNNFT